VELEVCLAQRDKGILHHQQHSVQDWLNVIQRVAAGEAWIGIAPCGSASWRDLPREKSRRTQKPGVRTRASL